MDWLSHACVVLFSSSNTCLYTLRYKCTKSALKCLLLGRYPIGTYNCTPSQEYTESLIGHLFAWKTYSFVPKFVPKNTTVLSLHYCTEICSLKNKKCTSDVSLFLRVYWLHSGGTNFPHTARPAETWAVERGRMRTTSTFCHPRPVTRRPVMLTSGFLFLFFWFVTDVVRSFIICASGHG